MMLKIKKLTDNATIPSRATKYSAGLDLHAAIDKAVILEKGKTLDVPIGIAMEIPVGQVGLIFARSGLSTKHGITLANCVGVVDSDYRGEIIISLINQKDQPYTILPNERIAQLVIMPITNVDTQPCDQLTETQRGSGGFGSTGK